MVNIRGHGYSTLGCDGIWTATEIRAFVFQVTSKEKESFLHAVFFQVCNNNCKSSAYGDIMGDSRDPLLTPKPGALWLKVIGRIWTSLTFTALPSTQSETFSTPPNIWLAFSFPIHDLALLNNYHGIILIWKPPEFLSQMS